MGCTQRGGCGSWQPGAVSRLRAGRDVGSRPALGCRSGRAPGRSSARSSATIDQGKIIVTNQRVVFEGPKQTRECLLTKLVGYEHLDVGDTVISVSNRQKPTRLHYADADSNGFQFGLALAIADYRGQTAQLVRELSSQLEVERVAEPQLTT